ncbi:hypothetical protein F4778DRAFT_636636 [Xylariomycetidae sp. FL2044]|nr:hypothetical protein F4778DRAFT_636636 [Xylariomycetidae sp. FL2044]
MSSITTQVAAYLAVNNLIACLAITTTGLRLYHRKMTQTGMWWDDGMIASSQILGIVMLTVLDLLATLGLGHPRGEMIHNETEFLKLDVVTNFCFVIGVVTTKSSILFCYLRIFPSSKNLRIASKVVMGALVIWAVNNIIQLARLCDPYSSAFHTDVMTHHCGQRRNNMSLTLAIMNIVTDAVVLILPLPVAWKLQVNRQARVKMTALFTLGLITTVIAAARCPTLVRIEWHGDYAIQLQPAIGLALMELNLSICCANAPMAHMVAKDWWRTVCSRNGVTLGSKVPYASARLGASSKDEGFELCHRGSDSTAIIMGQPRSPSPVARSGRSNETVDRELESGLSAQGLAKTPRRFGC